jgi:hypothetical protein
MPRNTIAPIHAPRSRPGPGPMRLALGLGGMAALSALATAIILPPAAPVPADVAAVDPTGTAAPTGTDTTGPTPTVRYVQLAPGESAPPGATVIPAQTSSAGTLVVTVAGTRAPGKVTTVPRPVATPVPKPVATTVPRPVATPKPVATVKTTQSGTPKP